MSDAQGRESLQGDWRGTPYQIDNVGLILQYIPRGVVRAYDTNEGLMPSIYQMTVDVDWLKLEYGEQEATQDVRVGIEANLHINPFDSTARRVGSMLNNFLVPPKAGDSKIIEGPLVFERASADQAYYASDTRNGARLLIRLVQVDEEESVITLSNRPWQIIDKPSTMPKPLHTIEDLVGQLRTVMDTSYHVIGLLNQHHLGRSDWASGEADMQPPPRRMLSEPTPEAATPPNPEQVLSPMPEEPAPTTEEGIIQRYASETLFDSEDDVVTLDSIGGLDHIKHELQQIVSFFQHPAIAAKWNAERPTGVLFHGPAGTGKTLLSKALAHALGADITYVDPTKVYGIYLGESQRQIKRVFTEAKKSKKPLVLFFDEIDGVIGIQDNAGSGGADAERNGVAAIFKQEMNDLARSNPNVLVVAATNSLERLDPALIRSGRFNYKLYVPLPNQEVRQSIFALHIANATLKGAPVGFTPHDKNIDVIQAAKLTDGMSGADIVEILRRVNTAKALQEATFHVVTPISTADIVQAIEAFRRNG